ncbi:hypothetical protein KR067_006272 [Drosophila pandora]|nr:hypothetical protein KR067_006272 [Drosophila pandora]
MEGDSSVATTPIDLRKFLEDYQKKLLPTATEMPFFLESNPMLVDVSEGCSLDQIATPEDTSISVFQPGAEFSRTTFQPQEGQKLPRTFTALAQQKSRSRKCSFGRTPYTYKLNTLPLGESDLSLQNNWELELTIRLYRPPRASHRGFKVESPVFAEEYVCLGSNLLTELRDKISCICKGKRFVDISSNPDAPLPTITANSGYFFINNTFYNDMRNPENCDYSATVIRWASAADVVQREPFKVENMEGKRFIDLTVTPGSPLHYLHHGNCEHLFVVSQVEVLTPSSKRPERSVYPYPRSINVFNRRTCYMCGLRSYHFIVEQSRRQLHDPSYLCRSCFLSFHYVDGQKVGHFKAYRIYEHSEEKSENDEEVSIRETDENANNEIILD